MIKEAELRINDRAFKAIKNGQKKVEIRANKKSSRTDYSTIKEGDNIIFLSNKSHQKLSCVVVRKTLYSSVRELLETEGTTHTLSSTDDIEKGIKSVESISNYKKIISRNGVFAYEIQLQSRQHSHIKRPF